MQAARRVITLRLFWYTYVGKGLVTYSMLSIQFLGDARINGKNSGFFDLVSAVC